MMPHRTLLHFIKTLSENPSTHGETMSHPPMTISVHRSAIFLLAIYSARNRLNDRRRIGASARTIRFRDHFSIHDRGWRRLDTGRNRRRFFGGDIIRMLIAVEASGEGLRVQADLIRQ